MFTKLKREEVLQQLITGFKKDTRIVSAVLVGSGAIGFTDEYSDIDIIVVVDPLHPTRSVFQEWVQRLQQELSVIHYFEVSSNENSFLAGFLLPDCLEVDFGVVSTDELTARKDLWKVLYDRTGKIETKLQISWEAHEKDDPQAVGKKMSSVWHYIIQSVVSVQRKQLWRAMHNLEEVRNRGLRLAGLRHELVVSHFRQIDQLPEELQQEFKQTIAQSFTAEEIMRALRVASRCFFQELRAVGRKGVSTVGIEKIETEMNCLLEELSE